MDPRFPVQVTQGEISVQAISGKIEPGHFILYLSTREKHPSAEVVCTGLVTQVQLFATKDTIRPSEDGNDDVPIRADEPATLVELPGDWQVGVSASKYTVCVMGVKDPEVFDRISFTDVPTNRVL